MQCWDTTASTELENLHGSAGEALWKSQMYTLILFWKSVSLDISGHKLPHQQPAHGWHQMQDNECPFECLETMSRTAGTLTDSTWTDRPMSLSPPLRFPAQGFQGWSMPVAREDSSTALSSCPCHLADTEGAFPFHQVLLAMPVVLLLAAFHRWEGEAQLNTLIQV